MAGEHEQWQDMLTAIEKSVKSFYIADDYTFISNIVGIDLSGICTVIIRKVIEEISFNSSNGSGIIQLTETVEEY